MTAVELLEALTRDRTALIRRQAEADRVVASTSAGHLVHELNTRRDEAGRHPWRVDPIPLVLDGATFDRLAGGVVERVSALEQVLADLHGSRRLVSDGIVPGEALSSTPRYRVGTVGLPPPRRWLTTYAVDVVALADGTWRIVRDLTDAPTGIGYALLDRAAMLPVLDEIGTDVAALAGVAAELRRALAANTRAASPRIVLFSGGADHAAYVEDSQLARLLGFTLVERPDVVVRQGRLWLRTLGGLDPIDVVYRRVDDDDLDPIELAAPGGSGVPGLIAAVAGGGVAVANAHGSGVIEDPTLTAFWPAAAEALSGRALRLPVLGDAARSAQLTTVPTFRAGELGEAAVVLRLHAVAGPGGVTVVPGGNGRVLAPGDDPQRPSARIVKDVWILDGSKALPPIVVPLPQVDLASSVPTRAADALFWAGRSAERAEAIARTIRVVAVRRQQDPALVTIGAGRWSRRMASALRAVGGGDTDMVEQPKVPIVELNAATVAATKQLAFRLRGFVAEGATVGEFLPASTARVLTSLAELVEVFDDGHAHVDVIEDALGALAAFAGLWNESTVRGPAWRFGDIGVRIERAVVVLELIGALAGPMSADDADSIDLAALEVVLAANESLVAYRRQYRSDVAVEPMLDLLLRDRDNPRSYASCLDRLAEHVADVDWAEGTAAVRALLTALPELGAHDVGGAREAVVAFANQVVQRWFATPVKPMLMRAGRAAG